MTADPGTVTRLLIAWSEGDEQALEELMPLVYDHLRDIAAGYLRSERRDHTFDPVALVHEAYLRLVGQGVHWEGRQHFFGIAATMMRRTLADHGKYHAYAKRNRKETARLSQEAFDMLPTAKPEHLMAVADALNDLEKIDPQSAKLVELRFFAGLNLEELASELSISTATVKRKWRSAKAWLYDYLVKDGDALS